jgi:hypothetical protein
MNRRVCRGLAFAAGLLLVTSTLALAQAPGLDIDFPFLAAEKTLKAGSYSVDIAGNGNVVLTAAQGGAAVEIPTQKQLSDRRVDRPELVFDVVGSARFLSEVKVPGKGHYLVARRGDAQERETVKGPKAGK